jgi:hypothetical protein
MDADSSVSADLVLVALSAPRSHPPPARPRRATRAGPPSVGPVRSTPERTIVNGLSIYIGKNAFCLHLPGRVSRVAKHCRAEHANFDSDSDSESKSI